MTPRWDSATRSLWLGSQRVKRYQTSAENQIAIIQEFESLGWPKLISDPLPATFQQSSKLRLNETIKSLNRGQKLIRFHGDGTGQGVWWELVE